MGLSGGGKGSMELLGPRNLSSLETPFSFQDFPTPPPTNPHLSCLCQENSYEALVEVVSENPRPALARSASSDTSEEVGGWAGGGGTALLEAHSQATLLPGARQPALEVTC